MLQYIVGNTWAGDTTHGATYNGFYVIVMNYQGRYSYRIQRDPWNSEYIVHKSGFSDFKSAESAMIQNADALRAGGQSVIDSTQRASSRNYL
jgi:hypothetical protein